MKTFYISGDGGSPRTLPDSLSRAAYPVGSRHRRFP